jgi:glycosyltransferase involved in cell wall biosynthesis
MKPDWLIRAARRGDVIEGAAATMHLAYIHQHFSTVQGNTGTRSYEMSRRLIQNGHRVTMICGAYDTSDMSATGNEKVATLQIDGITVKRINTRYSNKMSFFQRLMAFGQFARAATKVVSKLDADLVFATSTPLSVGLPGMKGARKLGVPFVFEVRDLWPAVPIAIGVLKNPLLIWYARCLETRIYKSAARIIALSPGMKDGIVRSGYPAERVTMIPNGCDLELFKPCDEPLNDPRFGAPDDYRLIFTGAHGLANGLDAVLDAAGVLKRRGVKGIRFVFLGKGGQKESLMKRSRAEGLDEIVCWVDSIPKLELARVLPRMDVGMMILKNLEDFYYGTSPNKFFDYIACGLPVLNNYPGWLAGMIAEKQCGRVVPPDDPEAFADAAIWFFEHRDEAWEQGRRARALAEERFAREDLADAFVKVMEEAYGSR